MISVGRVLMLPKGEWNAETTYHMLDLVNHEGHAYLAKQEAVIGIEPGKDDGAYWHDMLDLKKLAAESIAEALFDDVGDELFSKMSLHQSEAKYVEDLFGIFDIPTFVQWDKNTKNTPYTAELTQCTEGFAIVHGNKMVDHSVSAWVKGGSKNDCFTHTFSEEVDNGWDYIISASGGTMNGSLGLGGGTGTVSADGSETYLEAKKDEANSRKISIANPATDGIPLADSVKLCENVNGEKKEYLLFGQHNMGMAMENGLARVYSGTYMGDGKFGKKNPTILEFDFPPKMIFIHSISLAQSGFVTLVNPVEKALAPTYEGGIANLEVTWSETDDGKYRVTWYCAGYNNSGAHYATTAAMQMNYDKGAYAYIAIG